jgi:pectinesterase
MKNACAMLTLILVALSACCLRAQEPTNEPYLKLTVSPDGSGDFQSIQAAIDSTRDFGPGEVQILIKNGVYEEKIQIPTWKHQLTLVGEDREQTVIRNGDYSGKINPLTQREYGTSTSYTLLVEGKDTHLSNLTIQNSSCNQGQAVALHVDGDRFVAENCNLLGCQDTLYTASEGGRQYFKNCLIEGTTDFIFGAATVVFKDCTIKSLKGSFITAASTPKDQKFGYVFLDCRLIAADDVTKVYLGRPWRPYAQTVFINTEMGNHIRKEGWDPWAGDKMFPDKEKTAYYAEHNSSGDGSSPDTRVAWARVLDDQQIKKYTVANILKGCDDWNPENGPTSAD